MKIKYFLLCFEISCFLLLMYCDVIDESCVFWNFFNFFYFYIDNFWNIYDGGKIVLI